jgi:hypothetical protein
LTRVFDSGQHYLIQPKAEILLTRNPGKGPHLGLWMLVICAVSRDVVWGCLLIVLCVRRTPEFGGKRRGFSSSRGSPASATHDGTRIEDILNHGKSHVIDSSRELRGNRTTVGFISSRRNSTISLSFIQTSVELISFKTSSLPSASQDIPNQSRYPLALPLFGNILAVDLHSLLSLLCRSVGENRPR